jgi:hypothetical protein
MNEPKNEAQVVEREQGPENKLSIRLYDPHKTTASENLKANVDIIAAGMKAMAEIPEYQFSFLLYCMTRACGLYGEIWTNANGSEAHNIEFEGKKYCLFIMPEPEAKSC